MATFSSGSTMFELSYCEELNTPYIVFNDITLANYTKIIDETKDQTLFITEDDVFVMGNYFTRLKFETNDKLPYNKEINVSVCVISISSVFEQGWYYPQTVL